MFSREPPHHTIYSKSMRDTSVEGVSEWQTYKCQSCRLICSFGPCFRRWQRVRRWPQRTIIWPAWTMIPQKIQAAKNPIIAGSLAGKSPFWNLFWGDISNLRVCRIHFKTKGSQRDSSNFARLLANVSLRVRNALPRPRWDIWRTKTNICHPTTCCSQVTFSTPNTVYEAGPVEFKNNYNWGAKFRDITVHPISHINETKLSFAGDRESAMSRKI